MVALKERIIFIVNKFVLFLKISNNETRRRSHFQKYIFKSAKKEKKRNEDGIRYLDLGVVDSVAVWVAEVSR